MVFTLRTMYGREELVACILKKKVEDEGLAIYSVIMMPNVKNYLLVESDNETTLKRAIIDIPYVRKTNITVGNVSQEELKSLLKVEPMMQKLDVGIVVEIKNGYLKGSRARVVRVNPTKEEVTVEVLDAAVKIPITIKAESVKIIE